MGSFSNLYIVAEACGRLTTTQGCIHLPDPTLQLPWFTQKGLHETHAPLCHLLQMAKWSQIQASPVPFPHSWLFGMLAQN